MGASPRNGRLLSTVALLICDCLKETLTPACSMERADYCTDPSKEAKQSSEVITRMKANLLFRCTGDDGGFEDEVTCGPAALVVARLILRFVQQDFETSFL